MRYFSIVLAAVAGLSATVAPAQTYRAENDVIVTPQEGGLFAAETGKRFGANGAWCAAADYAMDELGAGATTRIYVRVAKTSPSAPVIFGLTPGDANPVGVSSTSAALRTVGANLSVGHAFQFCHDARIIRR